MDNNQNDIKVKAETRDRMIVRTSVIGILANILLAGFKAAVGLIANSIAVVLDAVNNLSDALSSVITIIGTKLASRKPDKKHPLGHGRIEYVSAVAVAALVLYAGTASLVESVKKIIFPEKADYSAATLIVVGSAVVVKLLLGHYVKRQGKKVNSAALEASGADALFDAIISLSVLASAAVYLIWGVALEAYVGVLISAFIIKSGVGMIAGPLSDILGRRVDREYLSEIRQTVGEDPAVGGVYDLILHSYGPGKYFGSVHVEVPDTMTADEIDLMERRIAGNVYKKHGVILAGIGIYSVNTKDDHAAEVRSDVTHRIAAHDGVLQIHGFYYDEERKLINADVILDFELPDRDAEFAAICEELHAAYPEYTVGLTMDVDV
ncbi:MAG: cation transporter [Clostridia bacterium]|nr:cation transporter [Clostridia bacterium]